MIRTSALKFFVRSGAYAVALAASAFVLGHATPAAAATQAGTQITNTATATYSDGSGNSYNSQSNTVTTTVQNAPAETISPTTTSPGSNSVSPGGSVTDVYTLTNVGNGSGYFQLSGTQGTNEGVTAGSGTFTQYVVTVPGQAAQTFTTIAAVNAYLATGNTGSTPFTVPQSSGSPTAANQITIGVTYQASSGATVGSTITTQLTATITQPLTGTAPAVTSSGATGEYIDNVVLDARMDVQKTAAVGGTSSAPTVTYTLKYNNGGNRAMTPVYSNALPTGSNSCAATTPCGIVVTDKLPSYSGTQLTLSGTPTFVTQPTGAVFIYSTNGTSWTSTSTGATYVGVFIPASAITGTFGASNPGSSQGNVPTAQLSFTFTINGSTAAGAANSNAITNVANSLYADSGGFIEGPGITQASIANGSSATTAQTAPAIANTTGTLTGSAQATSAAAPVSNAVLNGPSGQAGATGGDGTTNTDYTVVSYTDGNNVCCTGATTGGANLSVPASAAAITIVNTLQNGGNKDDTYNLTTAASNIAGVTALPAGWTVTFQSAGQTASGTCAAVTAGTVITSVCVPSGATQNYRVILTPPASVTAFAPYTPYGDLIVATSTNNNTLSNDTNDTFLVGGFVKISKTAADATVACATATTFTVGTTANPGDCLQYTLTYLNVALTGGTNDITLNASTIVITENGAGTASASGGLAGYTNNWATNTNGLYAAPVDSNGGTIANGTAGSTSFTDTLASLAAGASGNVTFKVQIK